MTKEKTIEGIIHLYALPKYDTIKIWKRNVQGVGSSIGLIASIQKPSKKGVGFAVDYVNKEVANFLISHLGTKEKISLSPANVLYAVP